MGASPEFVAIFEEIKALDPAAKLRLAADLLEAKRPEMAHKILEHVTTDLGAALALAKLEQMGAPKP